MKERLSAAGSCLLILILVPYLLTIFINGPQSCLQNKKADAEEFLPFLVSRQIPGDCKSETIKAQTVIARTNLYFQLQSSDLQTVLEKSIPEINENIWFLFLRNYKKFTEAAKETEDLVLTREGEFYPVPYHRVSAGITRSGTEVFHDEYYSYLEPVDSGQDKDSYDYLTSVYIEKSRLPKELEIKETDSQGYVLAVSVDGDLMTGETFRKEMGLPSSNFTIQEVGEEIRFLCKGEGHGLGMSQYGANILAKEKSSYQEILITYFPQFELERKTVVNEGRF